MTKDEVWSRQRITLGLGVIEIIVIHSISSFNYLMILL